MTTTNQLMPLTWWIFLLTTVSTPATGMVEGGSGTVVSASMTEPTIVVLAVLNSSVALPCDINPPVEDDKTIIVLWYRDNSGNPIFSLDLRGRRRGAGGAAVGKRESDDHVTVATADDDNDNSLQNRTSFRASESPAYLQIQNVRLSDERVYRCRVDFQKSPTRNSNVNVTVIVPPQKPTILDEKGLELSKQIGPYNEGSKFALSCESGGGKPPPNVTWWRDSTLLDESFEVTSVGIVRNDILISSLGRADFRAVFRCEASNSNLTVPTVTEVTLELNLKPLEVRILQERRSFSAGKQYQLTCQSSGSRPEPIMAWWKGNKRIKSSEEHVSADGNLTTNVLRFVPSSEDNGKYLSCRAENPTIARSGLESGWIMNVHYAPLMSLKLGRSLKEDNIREEDDVYFECNTRANPFVHKVEWKFQGEFLSHNPNQGILISNQSLVIQNVQRPHAGFYTCVGSNTEGVGESEPLDLQVKHKPFCKPDQPFVYGIARHEAGKIVCEVVAYPREVEFKWTFNLTSEVGGDASRSRITSDQTTSSLLFTPHSDKDYGNVFCWGQNEMGMQRSPCVFTLVPVGPPDPVRNCTISNRTETAFYIQCLAGADGGLNQTFELDLYNSDGYMVKALHRHTKPEFFLNGLRAGAKFNLSVYASNAKGRSRPMPLVASTKEAPSKNFGSNRYNIFAVTPILGVLIGIVAAFTLVAIAIVIAMRVRTSTNNKRKEYDQEPTDRSNVPLRKDTDDGGENEEKSPDVIPCSNDHEFPSVEVKCLQKFGSGGTLERKCENCRSPVVAVPPYTGLAPEQLNHSWNQGKKVRPYDEMQYVEMQTPSSVRKVPPPVPIRREQQPLPPPPPDQSHLIHCSSDRGFQPLARSRPNYDIMDLEHHAAMEASLMKMPHENLIPAMMSVTSRRTEPETTAF